MNYLYLFLKFASAELDESKVVTNVMSSVTFIINGWEINDNDDDENDIKNDNDNEEEKE